LCSNLGADANSYSDCDNDADVYSESISESISNAQRDSDCNANGQLYAHGNAEAYSDRKTKGYAEVQANTGSSTLNVTVSNSTHRDVFFHGHCQVGTHFGVTRSARRLADRGWIFAETPYSAIPRSN
jgi:hypothetical protein